VKEGETMKLKRNDLMKCNQCGQTTKVKDLKRVNERRFEDGVEADLVCPFCDSPKLSKVEAKP
jgi:ssDNA-binding Zn-finger/Zn-ribbon topoisomerase 1